MSDMSLHTILELKNDEENNILKDDEFTDDFIADSIWQETI